MKISHMLKALSFVVVLSLLLVSVGQAQAQSRTVRVISVSAPITTLGSDTDQIFFRIYNSTGGRATGIPAAQTEVRTINKGGSWELNRVFTMPEGSVSLLRLLESDLVSDDDLIGEMTIDPSTPSGQQTKVWTGDFSNYVVVLEIN